VFARSCAVAVNGSWNGSTAKPWGSILGWPWPVRKEATGAKAEVSVGSAEAREGIARPRAGSSTAATNVNARSGLTRTGPFHGAGTRVVRAARGAAEGSQVGCCPLLKRGMYLGRDGTGSKNPVGGMGRDVSDPAAKPSRSSEQLACRSSS